MNYEYILKSCLLSSCEKNSVFTGFLFLVTGYPHLSRTHNLPWKSESKRYGQNNQNNGVEEIWNICSLYQKSKQTQPYGQLYYMKKKLRCKI